MPTSRIVTIIAAPLVALILACSGATTEKSGDEDLGPAGGTGQPAVADNKGAPVTVAAGQTMTLAEQLFGSKTVVEITLTNVKYNVKASNGFSKPAKGQFVTADVTALVKEGKVTINSTQFKLVAADGTAFDSTLALDGNDLSANELTPGQKTSGQVVFDAAKGAEKGGRIALKSWLAEGDAGYWTL